MPARRRQATGGGGNGASVAATPLRGGGGAGGGGGGGGGNPLQARGLSGDHEEREAGWGGEGVGEGFQGVVRNIGLGMLDGGWFGEVHGGQHTKQQQQQKKRDKNQEERVNVGGDGEGEHVGGGLEDGAVIQAEKLSRSTTSQGDDEGQVTAIAEEGKRDGKDRGIGEDGEEEDQDQEVEVLGGCGVVLSRETGCGSSGGRSEGESVLGKSLDDGGQGGESAGESAGSFGYSNSQGGFAGESVESVICPTGEPIVETTFGRGGLVLGHLRVGTQLSVSQ